MTMSSSKKISLIAVIILFMIIGGLLIKKSPKEEEPVKINSEESTYKESIIGQSVDGRKIKLYTFGTGEKNILFVGGIHGGYEWNSVLLAYKFINYLKNNSNMIPKSITVNIIPSMNPDGLYKITKKEGLFNENDIISKNPNGLGRFNSNDVDLNRNFDCKWKPKSTWRGKTVSAGTSPFSEPESKALRNFILKNDPVAVVFWHSQSNAVYASECKNGIIPETIDIMNTYSKASGYPAIDSFDAYEITGDAEGWLASIDIPAITVELSNHETIEWSKNLLGIEALLNYYDK